MGFCQIRAVLKERMQADLRVYRDSVIMLERTSGQMFAKAHKDAEHARLAYEVARRKLDDHIASHGCD
jgi:hypothetical protein